MTAEPATQTLPVQSDERSNLSLLHSPFLGPVRVMLRFTALLLSIVVCYLASLLVMTLRPIAPHTAGRLHKGVARAWVAVVCAIIGMRLRIRGTVPDRPYFLVINHISWIDLFLMYRICDALGVLQEEDEKIPFVGRILKGLRPIFVKRHRDNIARGCRLITEALEAGENVMLAPEGVVGPGRAVRRFKPALLQPAIDLRKPVHYAAITCRTPRGCRPASKSVLFGPDPFYRDEHGNIPQSELEAWGPEKNFLFHLFGMLALPWFEVTVTFAPEPITAPDRQLLAERLQQAVQSIFIPVP